MGIKNLYQKHQSFIKQFLRYFLVALIGYIVDFGTLALLVEVFHFHYLIGASTGFILGLIAVYTLSSRFVFGVSKMKSKSVEFTIFAIIGLIGLIILNLLMWLFTDGLGVAYILSKIIATVFVYMWNFFARRALYHNEA